MVRFRWSIFFAIALSPVFSAFAHGDDWLPIDRQQLEMKDFPAAAGAAAVQLYYRETNDDEHNAKSVYRRIKILSDKGKRYADVQIEMFPFQHLSEIKARTIHPDGTIAEFDGRTFEKTIFKTRDAKFLARTFTMPEVTVGSIIEYRYQLSWDPHIVWYGTEWQLQDELYTLKERFEQRASTKFLYWEGLTKHMGDSLSLSYVYSQVNKDVQPKKTANMVSLELENIPGFEPEEFMPPEVNFRPEVRFFYGGRELASSEEFWRDYGLEWFSQSERFIGNSDEVKRAAAESVSGESEPQKKLFKLYARAQKVRNLSFERFRSDEESKKENLKANENAADVLNRGYGKHNDITRLFVALARAAGFETSVVRVSSRRERFFDRKLLRDSQLSTEIAAVKFNGNDVYLDPGTRFCPFGVVRWENSSVAGLKLDKNGGVFVTVSTGSAEQAVVRRVTKAKINEDGDLEGDLMVEYRGQEALQRRLTAGESDEAGRKKQLEDELHGLMPNGAVVKLKDSQGWEETEAPLVANFSVRVPSFASVAGKRLLIPAALFKGLERNAFQHAERKYPVYFHYAHEELDNLIAQVPEGYSVDTLPVAQDARMGLSRFITARSFDKNQFVSKRALVVNAFMFQPGEYEEARKFFNKVLNADDEQAVLKKSTANAKSN